MVTMVAVAALLELNNMYNEKLYLMLTRPLQGYSLRSSGLTARACEAPALWRYMARVALRTFKARFYED